jgi:predicted phage terminase large subunit-like protein
MENISAADQAAIESARLELRLLQIEAQEKAQKDFLSFAKYVWPEGIFGAHHAKMADAFNRIADGTLKRLIVNMPPRHALARETRIPTTSGWKTIEQLGPRDMVFGPDGKPVKVLGKSEVFKDRELYRVTTDDGFSLVVDGEHLWTVRLSRTCKVYHTYKTEDLWKREQGVVLRTKRNGEVEFLESRMKSPRPPRLPDVLPVEYRTKRLPIDPYVLGVWLGDGTSRSGVITCAADDAVHMRKVFEERGYRTTDHACSVTFGVKGLQDKLRKLGVLQNKHIPLEYLQADVSQRRWLLKGLMDTDGTVGKRGQCVFCQSNYDFIVQVRELLCSLGIKNSLIELDAKIGEKNYGKTWRICFYAKDIAHLQRKEERTIKTALKNGRYIRVEKLGTTGDTQCIRVDREDGLFLAGEGFICTHNTKSEFSSYLLPAFIMGRQPKTKIIQATHTGELAVRFGRKVRNLMDTDEYKQVFSDVALRADSKAAGRWDTDHGGEYFACLRPYALVHTDRGQVPAGEIKQGDVLLNCGKAVTVQEVYHSKHKATYNIAGLDCSSNHPIWTMNRGWVYAADVVPTDVLCAESISDIMKAHIRRVYGYLEHTIVSPVVQHEVSMLKPKEREVAQLRRAWHYGRRAMAGIRELLGRYGRAAVCTTYDWKNRQRGSLQRGQLSLGNTCSTGQQSTRQCDHRWEDIGANSKRTWNHTGSGSVSFEKGTQSIRRAKAQEEELSMYGDPKGLGWFRRATTQLLVRSVKAFSKANHCLKGNMAGIGKATQDLCGLLLGVRLAGHVSRTTHQDEGFINFLTDGDHTFFAEGVLTHNCGVGGAMTGRGADLLIIDDPHSEQDAMSELALENAWEWYTSGPRQRLQPGGAIIIVMTRWTTKDLTAKLIKAQTSHKADRWEVIEFPAILPSEKPMWPEFWKLEELLAVKASLSPQKWQAQWQQQPSNDEGAILKREWWRVWPSEEPPPVEYIIQSYDTAYSKKETADYSAITTWGVFYPDQDSGPNIILLDVTKGRWDFPELKRIAKDQYDQWQPDNVLIEAKATGITLQQELRRMGIPVTMYSPGGRRAGQDKVSRAHSIAPLLEAGMVWAPDTDWAEDLVEECAAFPNGDNDDLVDSTVQCLMRFRTGNFLTLNTDDVDEEKQQDVAFEYY